MKKLSFFFALIPIVFIGACSHQNPLSEMHFQTISASPHIIASWYKITSPGEPIKIYIEGDEYAFDPEGKPSDNPTPQDDFMRELAARDPNPNVAYLGLPCQYLQVACSQADWSTDLLADKNKKSMEAAIQALMKKANTNQVILIGYLGGAKMAETIAKENPKQITNLITITKEECDPQKIYEVQK